jgi:predicted cupin superfamily sugar epimerase
MAEQDAQYWIDKLQLQPHPEGGFYRVTYTAATRIAQAALPSKFKGARPTSTAIYFLLTNQARAATASGHFSAFHRLQSDEMWHFYAGDPLVVHQIAPDGSYTKLVLGSNIEAGEDFQAVVEAGCWFASAPLMPDSFALVGCTVSPGFDFADFELGTRVELTAHYPQHAGLIEQFTRV